MKIDRRTLLATGLAGSAMLSAARANAAPAQATTIKLWPKGAPGGQGVSVVQKSIDDIENGRPVGRSISGVTEPIVTIHKAKAHSDTAILVIAGGGFRRVMLDKEGEDICKWLNAQGVSAGSLLYRLPGDGWAAKEDAPLHDAKRAALILARETGAKRIGIMGFSAGGTIAAGVATRWNELSYDAVDAADASGAKPSFMALGYPYLNSPAVPGFTSMYRGMTAASPPAFFFLAADDKVVTPDNSITAFRALSDLKIPAALHAFEDGGHGFALIAPKTASCARWPDLFMTWARAGRYI